VTGDPYTLAHVRFCAGMGAYFSGELRRAVDLCRSAQEIGRQECTGVAWEMNSAQLTELWGLAYLGELRELGKRLPELLKEARERDDVFAETSLRLGLPALAWLAEDRPADARAEVDQAMGAWSSRSGFTSQHYFEVVARVHIDLYEGRGAAAWERITEAWPKLEASLVLRLQHIRIELHHLRARAALAAAAASPAASSSSVIQKRLEAALDDAKQIAGEDAPWAPPLATLIRAGAAAVEGDEAAAASALLVGGEGCADLGMALHAAAARLFRAALTGGPGGRADEEEALVWMREHGIKSPRLMAAILIPGFRS
jgi:hypothetical protein